MYGKSECILIFGKAFDSYVKQFFIIKNHSNSHQLVPYNLDLLQVHIYSTSAFPDIMKFSFEIHDVWSWDWRKTIFKNLPNLHCWMATHSESKD